MTPAVLPLAVVHVENGIVEPTKVWRLHVVRQIPRIYVDPVVTHKDVQVEFVLRGAELRIESPSMIKPWLYENSAVGLGTLHVARS